MHRHVYSLVVRRACTAALLGLVLHATMVVAEAAPTTPTGVAATPAACNNVAVSWNASTSAAAPLYGYRLYRDGVFFRWVLAPSTTTRDWNVSGGTALTYRVVAVDETGAASAQSAGAVAVTPPCADMTPPSVPTEVTAEGSSCSTITLAWHASSDGGGFGVRGYNVYRGGILAQQVLSPGTSAVDVGVAPSTTYAYAISAVDKAGNESSPSASVAGTTPSCGGLPPRADAGPDVFTQTFLAVTLNGAGSSDPDDGIGSYEWRFGDGTTGVGAVVSHAYGRPGVYVATLTVTDRAGLTDDDTVVVGVLNRAPVARAGADQTVARGVPVVLNGAASIDPDGTITEYAWNFGDGASGTGASLSHLYAVAGTYTVTLTVTDNEGARGSDTALVRVTETAPPDDGFAERVGGLGADIGQGVALAPDGSVVVVGRVNASTQMLVTKYSATGDKLWERVTAGPGSGEGYAVAVDGAGNIVVVGWFLGSLDLGGGVVTSAGSMDIFVAKYAGADGRHLWSRRMGGALADIAYGVATDAAGDVVVTGFFTRSADLGGGPLQAVFGGLDTFVAKYAGTTGAHLWSRDVGHASDDIGLDVVTDGRGDVVVTGFFKGFMDFGGPTLQSAGSNDVFLAKLAGLNGATLWAQGFGGTLADRGNDVDIDAQGNILLTGFLQGTADLGTGPIAAVGGSDVFVAKYGANGQPLWVRSAGSPGEDYAYGLAVDDSGGVVMTGRFKGTINFGGGPLVAAGEADVFLARYNATTGAYISALRVGGPGADVGNAVAAVGSRAVVTGSFEETVDFGGAILVSVDFSDLFVWSVEP